MHPSKAPGPDGLSAGFFQRYQNIVGRSVSAACLEILNGDWDLSLINHTYVALIPKVKELKRVSEYRPISLCNIIYKIISKCFTNRPEIVLEHLISPYQSTFIPQRLITYNIIIGYECLHKIRCRKQGKEGLVAVKLDNIKAYDRIEWCFVEIIMPELGFSYRWVSLTMKCIMLSTLFFLLNGEVRGLVKPQRGLHKDVLFPLIYLFYV